MEGAGGFAMSMARIDIACTKYVLDARVRCAVDGLDFQVCRSGLSSPFDASFFFALVEEIGASSRPMVERGMWQRVEKSQGGSKAVME